MDTIGTLELSWAQGYNGAKAEYIDNDVVCFICGKNIKFIAEDTSETIFPFPGEGIGKFAVHVINRCFAIADSSLKPKIHVYVYPTFREMAILEDGARLEYSKLVFSSSEYLASVSGVPDFELILWKYETAEKLCSISLSHSPLTSVSFNPINWRQICVTTEKEMTLLQTERSDNTFVLQPQAIKVPAEDPYGQFEDEKEREHMSTRASTRMTRYTVELPKAAIAGLVGSRAERLNDIQDTTVRVCPISHAWNTSGDIYVGCQGGQLLKVDGETCKANMIYYPPPRSETTLSRSTSAASRPGKQISMASIALGEDYSSIIMDGGLNCLGIHKRGLYALGTDGVLRMLDVSGEELRVTETCSIGVPITSMSFSPTYMRMVLGSPQGTLYLYEPGTPESLKELVDFHFGNFIAMSCLVPGCDNLVSVREDGEVQVWTVDRGKMVASYPLGIQVCSLAASPISHTVAVGTMSGHLYILDMNKLENIRIIHRVRVHNGPLSHLVFDHSGHYMLTGSEDGHVFIIDGRPSKAYKILGYTDVKGEVLSLSTCTEGKIVKVVVTINRDGNHRQGATKIIQFELNEDLVKDIKNNYASLKCDFKDEAIKKMALNLANPSYGGAVSPGRIVFTLSQKTKEVHQITLPEEPPKKANNKASFLSPSSSVPGHQLPGGNVLLSPHQKWLASWGPDGSVQIRATGSVDRFMEVKACDYRAGGVQTIAYSDDAKFLFTSSYDGVLACYEWFFSSTGLIKAESAVDAARAKRSRVKESIEYEDKVVVAMTDWAPTPQQSLPGSDYNLQDREMLEKEKAIANDLIYSTPTPTAGSDATWLQTQEIEALKVEDRQYTDLKKKLRINIRDMRKMIQGMIAQNEILPGIEKLGRHEFDLDVEEQTRLQAEGEAEVQRIREEIEFENLAKMYLREVIKRECWDEMKVKGRAIQSFNSTLEVSNFPMKNRSPEVLAELETAKNRRQVEITDLNARKEIAEANQKPHTTAHADEETAEGEEGDDSRTERPSTTGSLGMQYGGGSELYYSQFELHAREEKAIQITLLRDAVHRIKNQFNKDFDEVYHKKIQEITKIKEKNKRISKILDDLDLVEKMLEPEMGVAEKPERLLTVDDSEVKVEKFLTPEQKKKQEEFQKAEDERRQRERGDNARDRALDMMMGGVLEIKKEDELKKDIPMPFFMVNKKEDDWSEDEIKAVKDYEKRVKELNEERDKYRKQLETELRKLQLFIQDSMIMFDDVLNQLFMKKIKVMMVIYQEELKINRLRYGLLMEEELETREAELERLLDHQRNVKQLTSVAVSEARKNVDAFREQYDILMAEDRVMDRAFKREFNDVTALQADQLYRLFRRRPRGPRVKGADTPLLDTNAPNPFSERPSTARQNAQADSILHQAMEELDKETNIPEGIEMDVWLRLCHYRKEKIDNEHLVKQKALILAEMNAFMQKRLDEDEQLRNEIEDILLQLNKLKEDRQRFHLNLEVQLMLKQGQVEVDSGQFIHEYKESVLVHRSVVEELNSTIKQLGESKITSMKDSKEFRKGITQLEWEHKRMLMQMEDFQNKMKDIQFMKVTREIQAFLNEVDYDAKKSQEIATLEQTILMQKKHHNKNIKEKERIYKDLRQVIKQKSNDNVFVDTNLQDLNVSVNERTHIDEVNAESRMDTGADRRYQEIVQRRKLVDLAKAQAQEVAVLRAEVERLRMRTFPALVQVEH